MLRAETISNYSNVSFQLDKDQSYLLNIVQTDDWNYESLIGRFNFYTKEGFLLIPNKKQRKEFKQWKSLLNTFFVYNPSFGWHSDIVEHAMNAGKELIKSEKKAAEKEYKERQINNAIEFLNKVNNRDHDTIQCIEKFQDKTDDELITIINNTFKNEISKQLTNEILTAIKAVFEPKTDNNSLTMNEKKVIATRLNMDITVLNNSVFTNEELKNATIIGLINNKAENMVNNVLLENENINLTNKSLYEWNSKERSSYNFYINNIKTNILDGNYNNIVEEIRNEYKEIQFKLEYRKQVEDSYSLPDHEVTLEIFIERSCKAENILKAEHENIIKKAIENGLHVPENVMKDYQYLLINNSITETKKDNKEFFIVGNRNFDSYENAYNYCLENDYDTETMIIKEVANMQPLELNNNKQSITESNITDSEPELFYFYKESFNTYMDAYNHAIKNMSSVTMVISSKHPYMTNERLQELEKEYIFSKMNMSITDMKEYFNYISELPITLDQEERYYKLKNWIERYENRQRSIKEHEKQKIELNKQAEQMLIYMCNNGLEIKSTELFTYYYYKGEKVHSWLSGISIEEYYKGVKSVYDTYFNQSKAV